MSSGNQYLKINDDCYHVCYVFFPECLHNICLLMNNRWILLTERTFAKQILQRWCWNSHMWAPCNRRIHLTILNYIIDVGINAWTQCSVALLNNSRPICCMLYNYLQSTVNEREKWCLMMFPVVAVNLLTWYSHVVKHDQVYLSFILVRTTIWTPALGGLFVWMCMYLCVRGHDPILLSAWPHIARHMMNGWLWNAVWFNLHIPDGAIHYKLYLLTLTMAVDNFEFRIIRGAF